MDYGIDDDFVNSVREQVTEGTSALFLLTGAVTLDKIEDQSRHTPIFSVVDHFSGDNLMPIELDPKAETKALEVRALAPTSSKESL